jgi:flagellar P-ring protein FlgI
MIFRFLLALLATFAIAAPAQADRIKDLGGFQGIRTNQLTGYGIVVGLPGTGDDNLEYTVQSMKGVTARFGLALPPGVNPSPSRGKSSTSPSRRWARPSRCAAARW